MGFEPTLPEGYGLAVHRLNHSATLSHYILKIEALKYGLGMLYKKESSLYINKGWKYT